MELTEKETKLIQHIIKESNFNCEKLDLSKSWEEQSLENEDYFESFVDLKEYNEVLGTNNAGSRGVLGSLTEKGIVETQKEENDTGYFYWLFIDEDGFNKLKEALC